LNSGSSEKAFVFRIASFYSGLALRVSFCRYDAAATGEPVGLNQRQPPGHRLPPAARVDDSDACGVMRRPDKASLPQWPAIWLPDGADIAQRPPGVGAIQKLTKRIKMATRKN